MTGPLILVVDDEEPIRKLLARFLGRRGYRVSVAEDGAQALRLVGEVLPALVITDINMPSMDGIELISRLRTGPATRTLPVVLLTATQGLGDAEFQGASGADAFLVKPIAMADLLVAVEGLLGREGAPPAG